MKVRFFLLALLSAFIINTQSIAQTKAKLSPVAFNDELAGITDSLYNLGQQWGTKFQELNESSKDFSQLAPIRKELSAFILRKTQEVQKLPKTGVGSDNMKMVMIDFLIFERDMVQRGFLPIEQLSKTATEEEVKYAMEKLSMEASKENVALEKVNEAQEKYAAENDFNLEAGQE
jgi:hypothetical protein